MPSSASTAPSAQSSALPAALSTAPILREPLHHAGQLAFGPALGGASYVSYPLADPRRMRQGLIVGAAGTGVSNLATVLAVTARAAMPLATVYINGHSDLTNPALAHGASVLINGETTAETARIAAAALERAIEARARLLATMQAARFPTAGVPGLLVVIKDAEQIFAGHGDQWVALLRQASLLGIGVLALVHNLTLASFDGTPMLRQLLLDQVVALRTRCRLTADLLADARTAELVPDPRLTLRETQPGEGRLFTDHAGHREVRAFTSFRLATSNEDELIEQARRRWLAAYPDTVLDTPTREAFGDLAGGGV
jgi:hypothetical protein